MASEKQINSLSGLLAVKIACCRFIYSEGLLFVLGDHYITRQSFNVEVILHLVNALSQLHVFNT